MRLGSFRPYRLLVPAFLAGALAAPVLATAQTVLVVDGAGRPVGVVTPLAETSVMADPMVELMAEQQAMMQRMQAQMMALATGSGMASAVAGSGETGASVTVSEFSSSSDGCTRAVVWHQGPSDAAPVVEQAADRCGAVAGVPPRSAAQQDIAPGPAVEGPKLQSIVDRHPVRTATPKRF